MKQDIQPLIQYLQNSPTAFQACENSRKALAEEGFTALLETEDWNLKPGAKHFVIRGGSSLVAFVVGKELGFMMAGAHTDSPSLKIKPNPEIKKNGYLQLGVAVYGGALLHTWFDRDLSIAGRVHFLDAEGKIQSQLIDFQKPVAVIPNLAIHLRKNANDGWKVNAQTELSPIVSFEKGVDFSKILLLETQKESPDAVEILEHDLFFYPVEPPRIVGLKEEFLASPRLDNLLSCFAALQALVKLPAKTIPQNTALLVLSDHEEVGSSSYTGAGGSFLLSVLRRIAGGQEKLDQAAPNSFLVSVDNAHGVHPSYADSHDSNHGPMLGGGPVIKSNANQRYATNSEGAATLKAIAKKSKTPLQSFVTRSDMGCGSTIGPMTASQTGINTLDLGVPTFAMHSTRELAAVKDVGYVVDLLSALFKS